MTTPLTSSFKPGASYRLLELTPELQEGLNSTGSLRIKCPRAQSTMVVCTDNATYKLRQMNQTNTLLLLRPDGNDGMAAFGSADSYLEAYKMDPIVDFSKLPKYQGLGQITGYRDGQSLAKLKVNSLASDEGFDNEWYHNAGVELNGCACLLEDGLLKSLLGQVVTGLVAARVGLDNLTLSTVVDAVQSDENDDIIHTVVRRFSKQRHEPYDLDPQQIVTWLGLQTLREHALHTPMPLESFFQHWRDSIPIDHEWDLSLDLLVGSHVMPTDSTIRYLTLSSLSDNPKSRFQQLLAIKSAWELQEMVPFIDDLRNKAVKLESFVMKYARKKTMGNKIVVTSR